MASPDSGEPRESGGSLAGRPGFFFFRARQGHPLPALHALNSCAGTDLPVFTQKDITRRWAPSTPVTLAWAGSEYVIPGNRVMGAIAPIDDVVTLEELGAKIIVT